MRPDLGDASVRSYKNGEQSVTRAAESRQFPFHSVIQRATSRYDICMPVGTINAIWNTPYAPSAASPTPLPGTWPVHGDYQVFLGLDVGKDGHHAVALDRDGKRPICGQVPSSWND